MEFVEVAQADDLAEGEMRAVQVNGKRVLLASVEGHTYAIGAVCTHERAHLDEGALDGHEVYCPRHFSCFDIRTGEALEPPADRPEPVYAVKISDGKVLVSAHPVEPGQDGAGAEVEASAAESAEAEAPAVEAEAEAPATEAEASAAEVEAEAPATEPEAEAEASAAEAEAEAPATEAGAGEAEPARAEPAPEEVSGREPAEPPESAPAQTEAQPSAAETARPGAKPDAAEPAPPAAGDGAGLPVRIRPKLAAAGPAAWQQRLLELAEDLPAVESGAEALGAALQPIRESPAGHRLFDLLHGRPLGHALHPALSDLPIGFWSGTVLLDLIGEHRAAGVLSGAGVGAGVATAVTGVADWTVSDGPDRRAGLVHGVLQTAALGLQSASLASRRLGHLGSARALGLAGLALATGSAYLGGHLVFGRGLMVDHTAWHVRPRQWTRAIREDELAEGQTRAVDVEHRTVLFARIDGVVSAIDGICSHAGGPLARGKVEDGVVRCPWHGSCFRLTDGTVVRGPASHPQPLLETRATTDGWVEVRARRR